MREFANQHQQAINGDLVMRLVDIGADYERMRDFVLRGFQDDKRKELYKSLQRRAYRLACDWDLSVLCSQPTGFYRDAARLTATFSRRSPPLLFSGPKFIDTCPCLSGPYPTLKRMTSRSSPCTFSRFLMKMGSSQL